MGPLPTVMVKEKKVGMIDFSLPSNIKKTSSRDLLLSQSSERESCL